MLQYDSNVLGPAQVQQADLLQVSLTETVLEVGQLLQQLGPSLGSVVNEELIRLVGEDPILLVVGVDRDRGLTHVVLTDAEERGVLGHLEHGTARLLEAGGADWPLGDWTDDLNLLRQATAG